MFRVTVPDPSLAEDLRQLLTREGLSVEVRVGHAAMDPSAILAANIASLVIVGPLAAFLTAFAARAGHRTADDAYERLKVLLRARRGPRGFQTVMLADPEQNVRVLLGGDVPDEGLRALFALNVPTFGGQDPLTWDAASNEWRPRPYPARRSDLFGWFAKQSRAESPATWHLTRNPDPSPMLALCGAVLESPHAVETNPWRGGSGGSPCNACLSDDAA